MRSDRCAKSFPAGSLGSSRMATCGSMDARPCSSNRSSLQGPDALLDHLRSMVGPVLLGRRRRHRTVFSLACVTPVTADLDSIRHRCAALEVVEPARNPAMETTVGNYFVSNYPPFSTWSKEDLPLLESTL